MRKSCGWPLESGEQVTMCETVADHFCLVVTGGSARMYPECGFAPLSRHSWHTRHLRDLTARGVDAMVKVCVGQWRSRNGAGTLRFEDRLAIVRKPDAGKFKALADLNSRDVPFSVNARVSEQ